MKLVKYKLISYTKIIFVKQLTIDLWCLMPLSTTFHLYREETGIPRENH
jgi:hypothetical protein